MEAINIEEIKALIFDRDALVESPYRIYQLNLTGYRYYYRFVDGTPKFYPSVTTVIRQTMPTSPQLIEWIAKNGSQSIEKRDTAALYGTLMHIQFEKLLINKEYDFDTTDDILIQYMNENGLQKSFFKENCDRIKKDVRAFAQFISDYKVKPIAVEIGLASDEGGYAGCIDMVCKMAWKNKDITAIVDFKSGRKGFFEDHEIQLHLYKRLFEENFPIQIDRIFNFSPKDWRKEPTYNLKDQTDTESIKKVPHIISIGHIVNDDRDSTVTRVFGKINLTGDLKPSDGVEVLSLVDIVKTYQSLDKANVEGNTDVLEKSFKPNEL